MVHWQQRAKKWTNQVGLLQTLTILLVLFSHSGSIIAAPRIQQPQTDTTDLVYGLVGLLQPAAAEPANTELYTNSGIHAVVGIRPALDERLRWLGAQTPPVKVKIWGQWLGTGEQVGGRQLVVTGLSVVTDGQNPKRVQAIGEFERVNLRTRPVPGAPLVGEIRQGESYPIVGRDEHSQWWQLCCIDGESAWIEQPLVAVEGVTDTVRIVTTAVTTLVTPVVAGTVTALAPIPVTTTVAAPVVVTPLAPTTTVTLPVSAAAPIVVTPTPLSTVGAAPLWQASYFPNTELAGQPVATDLVTAIEFDWGSNAPDPQLPVDGFSARFEQTVPLTAGFYALRVQADDGVRVYMNDELLIDEWHTGEPPEYQVGRQLSGLTTFRVEYYESGGQASLQFDYTLVDDFPEWRAAYYDNIALSGDPRWMQAEVLGVDAALSHQWSLDSPVPDILPVNNWSARWTGSFPFVAGNYIFRVEAIGGVRVWLDENQVINQWQDGNNQTEAVFQNVGTGEHEVTIEYYKRGGIANLKVDWARIVQP